MSARRQARAITSLPAETESGPPAELYDPDHAVWRDFDLYVEFLERHGLGDRLPVADRLGTRRASPGQRRNCASDAWALQNGIVTQPWHADWHRLRAMGLIG